MKKRITLIVGVIGTGLLVASLSTWLYLGRRGSSGLENWIGRQVLLVLRYHLTPDISFDDLDYQAPRTVVVRHLTFASEGQTFLEISQARLELAEIPRRNRPILVQSIELGEPRLRFIVRPGVDGLVGWTQFVRPKVIADPEVVPPEQRLSEVLVLRRVAIRNAEVVYETLNGAGERMTLPGISLEMQTPPVANEPGWYQLIGRLQREPLFDAQIDGRINLDTGLLEVARLQLQAAIGEAQYATLPPAVQTFLRKHEVRGQLSLSAKGHVPLDAPAKAAGTLKAELREACFRYADTMFPVRQVTLDARVPDGEIDLKVAGVNFTQRGRPLLSIGEIAVQLAGLPEAGEPVHIRQLTVNAPHAPFDTGADGRLAGWHQLASAKPPGASTPRAADAQQPQAGSAPPAILQQVRLDAFAVCDGALTYRP